MDKNERLWAIEGFVAGIDELKTVLGADVAPAVDRVKAGLVAALADRDVGRTQEAVVKVGQAMAGLAALGDKLGEAEGDLMRVLTANFLGGLALGDGETVESNLERIQQKAGTVKKDYS
jgi:hypothetical protein